MQTNHLARHIKNQLTMAPSFYLTAANLEAMEHQAGTVHQWLRNHGYTNTTPLMPDGPHSDLISLGEDRAGDAMQVDHSYAHLRWICMNCQNTGLRHPATDHGADKAGMEMLRHSLDHPDCAEEVWLEAVA